MASQPHVDPLLGNRSPDEDEDDMDVEGSPESRGSSFHHHHKETGEHGTSARARKRIRGTRACDRCRRSKSRCDAPADGSHPCSNCRSAKLDCTMDTPTRKRGPPKGYLHNVESRLHSLQAIFGAILAHPDLTVRAACEKLSRDPTAEDIISSVQTGPFGPVPRAASPSDQGPSSKDSIRSWQDRLFSLLEENASAAGQPHPPLPTSIATLASTSRQLAPPLSPPPPTSASSSRPSGFPDPTQSAPPPRPHESSSIAAARIPLPGVTGNGIVGGGSARGSVDSTIAGAQPEGGGGQTSSTSTNTNQTGNEGTGIAAISTSNGGGNASAAGNGQASGQLSIDQHDHIHYHGTSSGLQLLHDAAKADSSSPSPIRQASTSAAGGSATEPGNAGVLAKGDVDLIVAAGELWSMPVENAGSAVTPGQAQMSVHVQGPILSQNQTTQLPPIDLQLRLLDLYFLNMYPSFPILVKNQFWTSYRNRISSRTQEYSTSFDALLLALLTVSFKFLPSREANEVAMEKQCFGTSKAIIDRMYTRCEPQICQALLILSFHQLGEGLTSSCWVFAGMAISVAQDLGLHRSSDNWIRNNIHLFTEEQNAVRKRIWYGCVKVDKYLSMYLGRPPNIREDDFDTHLPQEFDNAQNEETDIVKPLTSSHGFFTPVPGRLISIFNANVGLALQVGRILEGLYSVRYSDHSFRARHAKFQALKRDLEAWFNALPPQLKVIDHNTMFKAPPHLLSTHMEYANAIIVLHRPFLTPDGPKTPDIEMVMKEAWESCILAAQKTCDIMKAWRTNFFIRDICPSIVYDVFNAGVIWNAALSLRHSEEHQTCSDNLNFCQDMLKEMAAYPAATRCRQLLQGSTRLLAGNASSQERPSVGVPESRERSSRSAPIAASQLANNYGLNSWPITGPTGTDPGASNVETGSLYSRHLLHSAVPNFTNDPSFMNGYFMNYDPLSDAMLASGSISQQANQDPWNLFG